MRDEIIKLVVSVLAVCVWRRARVVPEAKMLSLFHLDEGKVKKYPRDINSTRTTWLFVVWACLWLTPVDGPK